MGRPTAYSSALGETIAAFVMDGKLIKDIEQMAGMPTRSTISLWERKHADFSDTMARARYARADDLIGACNEEIEELKGSEFYDDPRKAKARIAGKRLTIEWFKWLAKCLYPRMYADKLSVETSFSPLRACHTLDLSRFSAAPGSHLSSLFFENQGTFPA